MKLSIGLILAALHASIVHAQNTTTSDLFVNALKDLGLDAVAAAIDFIASDPRFEPIITELGAGNKTFFIPT
jgi:ABC-type branched-subunit amino acid transport system substrate-binding protein